MNFHCKAQFIGIYQFVRCLEDSTSRCSFAIPLGSAYLCNSPFRLNITKGSLRSDRGEDGNNKVLAIVE